MRTVFHMAIKDLKLITRDWVGLFFIVAFPILMGVFFGFVFGSMGESSTSLTVAIVDEDQSEMSARFVEELQATGNVDVTPLARAEAMQRVRRGQLVGMVVLPSGFGETAGIFWEEQTPIEVGIDPARKAEAGMLQGLIMKSAGQLIAARIQNPQSMRPFVLEAREEIARADDIPALMRPVLLQMMDSLDALLGSLAEGEQGGEADPSGPAGTPTMQLATIETIDVTREIPKDSPEAIVKQIRSPWDISFPQSTMWGVLGCAAGFAITIVHERKQGTLTRLAVAPVSRFQILGGKAVACFFAVVGVLTMMVCLGLMLGMRPNNYGQLLVSIACVAICFVGIMMLMSVIGKTEEAVSGAAWGANVVMAMFGGGMIPLAFMPGFMKTLSNVSPVKWSILSLEGAIWRGFTWQELLLPYGVLILIGLCCFSLGIVLLTRAISAR